MSGFIPNFSATDKIILKHVVDVLTNVISDPPNEEISVKDKDTSNSEGPDEKMPSSGKEGKGKITRPKSWSGFSSPINEAELDTQNAQKISNINSEKNSELNNLVSECHLFNSDEENFEFKRTLSINNSKVIEDNSSLQNKQDQELFELKKEKLRLEVEFRKQEIEIAAQKHQVGLDHGKIVSENLLLRRKQEQEIFELQKERLLLDMNKSKFKRKSKVNNIKYS